MEIRRGEELVGNISNMDTVKLGDKDIPFVFRGDEVISPNPIRDGLVLWYDFKAMTNDDESKGIAKDLSGNGNDGTLVGFDFEDGSGYQDGGLKFDGEDDYIERPPLDFSHDDFTVQVDERIYSYSGEHVTSIGEDGLEVGGRNLFIVGQGVISFNNYNTMNEVTETGFITTVNNENGNHNLSARTVSFLPSDLSVGDKYTVSGYMYINGEPIDSDFLDTLHSGSGLFSDGLNIRSDGYFSESFEVGRENSYSWLLQTITSAKIDDVIEVRYLMISNGNILLDWTPAPEDTVQESSTLNQSMKSYKLYNRALTEEEIRHNYEIEKERI